METYIICFSCGAKSLNLEGNCHEYMLSSPGCYEMFKEVLEREYTDLIYSKAHHYTMDAYAVQHPGEVTNRKAVYSVGIHLMSLYLLLEKGFDLSLAAEVKTAFSQFNKSHQIITPLDRPKRFEGLTIFDIWNNEIPEKHFERCETWAWNAWQAWEKEHETIEKWADRFLKATRFEEKITNGD